MPYASQMDFKFLGSPSFVSLDVTTTEMINISKLITDVRMWAAIAAFNRRLFGFASPEYGLCMAYMQYFLDELRQLLIGFNRV